MEISERRACELMDQPRSTQRYRLSQPDKDRPLVEAIRRLAKKYPRYGYRLITAMEVCEASFPETPGDRTPPHLRRP